MAMTGPAISRAPISAAWIGVLALLDVAEHIFHDHDGVIDHEADGEHHGQQRKEIDD